MAGEAILGLEPPTLTLKTAEHSALPSPDSVSASLPSHETLEVMARASLLDRAGVRLFKQALNVDLHDQPISDEQVDKLIDEVFGPRKNPGEVDIRAYNVDRVRRERLRLIATEGFASAAQALGMVEASLYAWSRQAIPRPFKTKSSTGSRSGQDQKSWKQESHEERTDISRDSRPIGTSSLVAAVLYAGEDYDTSALAWQDRALCAQTDPEAFFPEKGGSTREAKKVCLQCDVRSECLEYALANDERFGIWGGLSERERRRLKKRVL